MRRNCSCKLSCIFGHERIFLFRSCNLASWTWSHQTDASAWSLVAINFTFFQSDMSFKSNNISTAFNQSKNSSNLLIKKIPRILQPNGFPDNSERPTFMLESSLCWCILWLLVVLLLESSTDSHLCCCIWVLLFFYHIFSNGLIATMLTRVRTWIRFVPFAFFVVVHLVLATVERQNLSTAASSSKWFRLGASPLQQCPCPRASIDAEEAQLVLWYQLMWNRLARRCAKFRLATT